MKKNIFKIILFVFLFTALAVTLDFFLIRVFYKVQTGEIAVWNKIKRGGMNTDILISGDSRALVSAECNIMEKQTGLTCLNIAMNGNLFDIQYARWKMYLKYNKPPKVFVQVLGRNTLAQSEPYNPIQFLPYLDEPELYSVLRTTKRKDIFMKAKYIPLYGLSYFRTIRSLDVIADLYFSYEVDVRDKGFFPNSTKLNLDEEKLQELLEEGIDWKMEEAQVVRLEEIARYCKEQGIKFVLVVPPMYIRGREILAGSQEMLDAYKALADRLDIFYVSYFDHPLSENIDYFYNFQHTNFFGAKVFSEAFGNKIAAFLQNAER